MIPSRHKSGSAPWGGGSTLLCSLHPPQKLQFVLTQKTNSSTQFELKSDALNIHSHEDTHPDWGCPPSSCAAPTALLRPVRFPRAGYCTQSLQSSTFAITFLHHGKPCNFQSNAVSVLQLYCRCFSITQHTRTLNSQALGVGNLIFLRCSETLGKVTFLMRLFLCTQHGLLI